MIVKASGRSALILTAALLWMGPAPAASGAGSAAASSKSDSATPAKPGKYKHGARNQTKAARSADGQNAAKSASESKPVADADTVDATAIPASVANANAQLAAADTPTGSARAMSARANDILRSGPDAQSIDGQVVSADQLNDVDRALQEDRPAQPTMRLASAETTATPAPSIVASRDEGSTWDKTSLIGKVFIAFGGLLTVASAARMFMA